ncbi:DUF167 domain-containing protein [Aestuariispira insulae]|uniref:UPF0235 protein DFP90_10810 n=1 Tax=Aestuariispira insulae TaxID=1461337 RepID=A0A3D9HEU4_9PROT|nr:DUF167 family protein [Aestuariispira insulae]RED47993.1 hypothetical protein DFP90_10810 [Aestuariispira insulae]
MPVKPVCDGIHLFLRVTPKASANRLRSVELDGAGQARLKIQVTAPPEGGKANAAVIKLLSKALGIGKTSLRVVSGQTDRHKMLHIAGEPAEREKLIRDLLRENHV